MRYKKFYVIQINGAINKEIWYYSRKGQQFDAELEKRRGKFMYKIAPLFWVHPTDCVVVGTQRRQIYER
jgi:hypothetical protein